MVEKVVKNIFSAILMEKKLFVEKVEKLSKPTFSTTQAVLRPKSWKKLFLTTFSTFSTNF